MTPSEAFEAQPAAGDMAQEKLHLCLDREGEWLQGQPTHLKSRTAVALGGRDVRLLETECNGAALLSGAGSPILGAGMPVLGYGDAELYVKVSYAPGGFEYVQTPLRAPLELKGVSELELNILCVIGHQACTSVRYRAFFNAHCLFERI